MLNSFVIAAFFTRNTPYEKLALEEFLPNVKSFGIKTHIESIKSTGSWEFNTCYKPILALNALRKYPDKNVVLLDVDSLILQKPILLEMIPENFNIAALLLNRKDWYLEEEDFIELVTSTLFLRNNQKVHMICEKWRDLCMKEKIPDQILLKHLLKQISEPVFSLPQAYSRILTMPDGSIPCVPCDDPVIVTKQISRQFQSCV